MKYIFLLLTIITESAAVILMKFSHGFTEKIYGVAAFVCYGLSFVFLTLALKHLPAGIANAIWAGASVVLVAVCGIIFFSEQISVVQGVSILLIAAGIIGLNL